MKIKTSRGLRSNIIIADGRMYVKPVELTNEFGNKYLGCPNCKQEVTFIYNGRGCAKSRIPQFCKCGAIYNWISFLKE